MVDVTEYDRDNNDLHHEKKCLYYQGRGPRFCLSAFLLNVPSQQLWPWWDGQFT